MNEDQMRSFVAAVDHGSLGKAARSQYLTVPSLAHRINTIEAELGYRILSRDKNGVIPTEEGKRLYEAFKQALAILDGVRAPQAATPLSEQERVSIGVWWQIPPFFLEAVQHLYSNDHQYYIDYLPMDFNEAPEGIERGVCDLVLSSQSSQLDALGLAYHPIIPVSTYCIFAPTSPLASLDSISPNDLKDLTVYAGADYRLRTELADCSDVQEIFSSPNIVKESVFVPKLIQDCAQGCAVSFFATNDLTDHQDYHEELKGLLCKKMDWPTISSGAYLAPRASASAAKLLDDVMRYWRERGASF